MNIAFYLPHIDIQGTGVSLFDYCKFNQEILGNKSFMIHDLNHPANHELAIKKFKNNNIEIISLKGNEDIVELENKLNELNADAVYIQKPGKSNDGRFARNKPSFIHVIGTHHDPHGTVYAYASDWLNQHCTGGKFPVVPYMVHLPDHNDIFREKLKIPNDAIVFGRTGGSYSWNMPWVSETIKKVLDARTDVYFLFVGTEQFINHERVIFASSFSDLYIKRKFINTCDAMIHARAEGESFGMACAEFSYSNKPVITYSNSPERNHIYVLKDKGIYYDSPESLYQILLNFKPEEKDWNAYREFSPNAVIKQFKEVFIDKI
jgi:hypothetical protein